MLAAVPSGRSAVTLVEQVAAVLGTPAADQFVQPLRDAIARDPQDPRLWQLLGLILRDQDRREEAIPLLRRAADLAPGASRIAHALARTLFEAGLDSLDAYGNALRLAPGDPDVMAGLAAALAAAGRTQDAILGLKRILGRSPGWVEGHKVLSNLRWSEGEREGFTSSFSEALRTQPQNYNLWREQIISLLHAEQFDTALEIIARGRAVMGDLPMFGANEAVVQAELGNTDEADRLFAPFRTLDDAVVQVRWVRHLLRSGRPQQALQTIEPWLETPDQAKFWPYAATTWRLLGDPKWEWLEGDERFATIYDIADRLPPMQELAETLRKLHATSGQPLEQSVRGGSQTDGNLFHRIEPVIVQLREALRTVVREHAERLPPPDSRHPLLRHKRRNMIKFSGAWSVRLLSGGCHANHVHPMGWMSSALYVVVPDDLGETDAGLLTLGEPDAQLRLDLAPIKFVTPGPGRLALFPSTMWHGTRPFQSGERVTVAFDIAVPE